MKHTLLLTILSILMVLSGCTASTFGALGSGVTTTAAYPAPQLGIVTDSDLNVIYLNDDSPAEKAGIQVGDRLVDIRPAQPIEGVSMEAIPFSNQEAVWNLFSKARVLDEEATTANQTAEEGRQVIPSQVYQPETRPFIVYSTHPTGRADDRTENAGCHRAAEGGSR